MTMRAAVLVLYPLARLLNRILVLNTLVFHNNGAVLNSRHDLAVSSGLNLLRLYSGAILLLLLQNSTRVDQALPCRRWALGAAALFARALHVQAGAARMARP